MAELQPGHRIKDNDPRLSARVLTIVRVEGRFVCAMGRGGIESRIQACRIYTDGKVRRTGFSLLPDENGQRWKVGNEFAPFHPQASHVNPDYRDGWNACYRAALAAGVAWVAGGPVSDAEAAASVLTGRPLDEIKADAAALRERITNGVPGLHEPQQGGSDAA